jgi:AraC-like DNA-binding protein
MGFIKIDTDGDLLSAEDFEVKMIKCGREHCMPQKAVERRPFPIPYNSLHYVFHGGGYVVAGKDKLRVKSGEIFLLFADAENAYYPNPADPWNYIWADFTGSGLERVFARCGLTRENPVFRPAVPNSAFDVFLKMYDAFNSSRSPYTDSSAYFMLLLSKMLDQAGDGRGENADRVRLNRVRQKGLVREALTFLNDNYRADVSMADVSDNIGVSPSYLTGLFARELGISPMQYLTYFRIANACDLLKVGKYSVGDVGAMTGFVDPLYFSRCFSKAKGVAPSEYAARRAQDDPWEFFKQANIDCR